MNTVKAGQRVRRGRDEGVVCQVVRRHRQDGAVVDFRDGKYPRWVPLHLLQPVEGRQAG